ncbi:hypothetical protein CEXT_11541 [Caerostris extrusa]|uniref:Uncharacterized protein n=1 Tax=Caerostris extrusa TaxID=172846 RepID=A0AAV4MJM7_CAEEX|nr:hypothetical protein CEXT_11541 [Caerostris extrusa]
MHGAEIQRNNPVRALRGDDKQVGSIEFSLFRISTRLLKLMAQPSWTAIQVGNRIMFLAQENGFRGKGS